MSNKNKLSETLGLLGGAGLALCVIIPILTAIIFGQALRISVGFIIPLVILLLGIGIVALALFAKGIDPENKKPIYGAVGGLVILYFLIASFIQDGVGFDFIYDIIRAVFSNAETVFQDFRLVVSVGTAILRNILLLLSGIILVGSLLSRPKAAPAVSPKPEPGPKEAAPEKIETPAETPPGEISDKNQGVAFVLSLFVGVFGIDRFYTGHIGLGIGKLLTCGGLGIWALVDIILFGMMQVKDANGRILQRPPQEGNPTKEQGVSFLLSYFLGGLGIDRFYLGYTGLGIVKLLTCGGFGIWTLIDAILIGLGNMKDFEGNSLKV